MPSQQNSNINSALTLPLEEPLCSYVKGVNALLYTVKEVSNLSKVTVKTLHHYHKIGLLLPCQVSSAGYRLYGMGELERLQQILFYKELDFSLEQIKQLLGDERDRPSILSKQRALLIARRERMEQLIRTIDKSIDSTIKGGTMDTVEMFNGFSSEDEWRDALTEQNEYLKEKYGHDLLENAPIDVEQMNRQSVEAANFMSAMATALIDRTPHDAPLVRTLIGQHLEFLNQEGHATNASDFAKQTQFFLSDDFHRQMLESQQTGLAYFICVAARAFAQE